MDFVCIDSETCGFTGPIVLLQYGEGMSGEVHLYSPLREEISRTLDLLEWLTTRPILGFNLAFDWFKVQQAWTTLKLLGHKVGLKERPLDHLDAYALLEPAARDGPCLKPPSALDLMLHARKGPWQNLMARDPITVRRVPAVIAPLLRAELERRIDIPDIFFAKQKKKGQRWKLKERKDPEWVDVELAFHPSSALKALATQELGLDPAETLVFSDVEVDRAFLPVENQFAPFALSVGRPGRWNGAWPQVIKYHDQHWAFNPLARKYATLDIEYPRRLYEKWGSPAFGDNDSLLAIKSGAMRWKGFAANVKGLDYLREKAKKKMALAPRAPSRVLAWIKPALSAEEQVVLIDQKTGNYTTKKVVLEEISKMKECQSCLDGVEHEACTLKPHRAAERARLCLESKKAKKEVEVYDKLDLAGRFHVSTNVIGARSSRQSGGTVSEGKSGRKSSNVNPHAVHKKKLIRAQFPLAWTVGLASAQKLTKALVLWAELGYPVSPEQLVGGDFDKFEVCIADAYYEDPQLHEDLVGVEPPCERGECKYADNDMQPKCSRCTGKASKPSSIKIHAIVGTLVYKGRTYWEIRATDGKDRDRLSQYFPEWPEEHFRDLYTRAKSAFFALIYFGNEHTLAERLGIPLEDGKVAYVTILSRYPVMRKKREEFFEKYCPMRQPDGIGSKVYWVTPEDSVKSMTGFERFFTLENKTIRAIFELAEDVPAEWKSFKVKVRRRDREQTVVNAVRSALLAAGFGLQGSNMRAAGNHKIQSTGAELTKELEAGIWTLQPSGIHPWRVRPMNVHDELPTAVADDGATAALVAQYQRAFIERRKALVPLLAMKWKKMNNWAGK